MLNEGSNKIINRRILDNRNTYGHAEVHGNLQHSVSDNLL